MGPDYFPKGRDKGTLSQGDNNLFVDLNKRVKGGDKRVEINSDCL